MNYRINNHRIEVEDPTSKKFEDYCEELKISKIITDLLSGEKTVEITIFAYPDAVKFEIPLKKVNRNILPTLIGFGLTVVDDPTQTTFVLKVLLESKVNASHEYRHHSLGFCKIAGADVFLLHSPIGNVSASMALSTYAIPERTTPYGTIDSWYEFVEAEIIGNINLELALAIGAMAPIVHLLREDRCISLIPIIALIGQSSTGKTCALKCMCHLWGSCDENTGLLMDLNCTQTAFFEQISNFGIPALIDETSSTPEWQFEKVAYHLPTGKGRLRCNSDGTLKRIHRFSGVVVFTGESSLIGQCATNKKYSGIHARIFELTLPWTNDEYHAQRLEFGCKSNSGIAAPFLITWLMNNRDKLPLKYNQFYDKLKSRVSDCTGVEDRILKIGAMILVAAKALNCSLKLKLDIRALEELILSITTASFESRLHPEKLFIKLKAFVLDNNKAFPNEENTDIALKIFGARGKHKYRPCFWIRDEIFEGFLSDNGVTDISEMARTFCEKGWIGKRSDRGYKIRKEIGGVKLSYYCLYLDENKEKQTKKCKKPTSSYLEQKSKMRDLLKDEDDMD